MGASQINAVETKSLSFVERFNGCLRDQCLNRHLFLSIRHTRDLTTAWRDVQPLPPPTQPSTVSLRGSITNGRKRATAVRAPCSNFRRSSGGSADKFGLLALKPNDRYSEKLAPTGPGRRDFSIKQDRCGTRRPFAALQASLLPRHSAASCHCGSRGSRPDICALHRPCRSPPWPSGTAATWH